MSSFLPKGPWTSAFSSEPDKKAEEEGESLTTILHTEEERSALTILIADCTQLMRKSLLDTFDPEQTGTVEEMIEEATEQVESQLVLNPETDVVKQEETRLSKAEKAKKALEQRKKEIAQQKVQDLKRDALSHFDNWQTAVIQRVGEIVNSRKVAEEHKEAAKPSTEEKPIQASAPMKFKSPPEYDAQVSRSLTALYPPVESPLADLEQEKRALIMHSVLLLLLSLENYQSYSRVLLQRLTITLKLPIGLLAEDEAKIARGLLTAAENLQAEEERKKAAEENKDSRRWKVGLATVAGAALIGITGGLAAPLLAAGIGSVMGGIGLGATAAAGYLGTLAGSSVLVGGLFGAYGARMTSQMMDQFAREVEDFAFIPVRTYHRPRKIEKEYRRLRVAIGISGWLTNQDEVVAPWHVVGLGLETFALRFELQPMMALGNALTTMASSAAWSFAKHEIIKRTVFAALYAGLWPLGLLNVSRIIDNPWSVASNRAVKAGHVLAEAIINKAQGERPVTLIGYSLGAKVIFTCLQRLAERKAFGLVESVVLIGSPVPSDAADWRPVRTVVSGRVANVYSTKDYILAFLYRSSSVQLGVAGLQPIEGVAGIENLDASELVSGHTSYRFLTGAILRKFGFEDVDSEELEKEQKALREEEAREEKQRQENEKKSGDTSGEHKLSDEEIKAMEEEVERKNKQSYVDWAQEKMAAAGSGATSAFGKAKAQFLPSGQDKGSAPAPAPA